MSKNYMWKKHPIVPEFCIVLEFIIVRELYEWSVMYLRICKDYNKRSDTWQLVVTVKKEGWYSSETEGEQDTSFK